MKGQQKLATQDSLARDLRVGLLGSPYDWGSIDFETFKQEQIAMTLTSFAGTRDSNRQDLLLAQQPSLDRTSLAGATLNGVSQGLLITHNEHSLLECEIPLRSSHLVNSDWLKSIFTKAVKQLNGAILKGLLAHDERYVSTETIIARYGTQVMRVGSLLKVPQIHIENEALTYLIDSPWRNEHELDYLISHMVFYLEGDVLRTPYVQKSVYEFGTSIRGVSNSSVAKNLIGSFTQDALTQLDFQTATQLFEVQLEPFEVELATRESVIQRRKAA